MGHVRWVDNCSNHHHNHHQQGVDEEEVEDPPPNGNESGSTHEEEVDNILDGTGSMALGHAALVLCFYLLLQL